MSSHMFKSMERLKKPLLAVVGLLLASQVSPAALAKWENTGFINAATNIDATIFVNRGSISVSTWIFNEFGGSELPFQTTDTLIYTNRVGPGAGRMFGTPGFNFDYLPLGGSHQRAAKFFNGNNAVIEGGELQALFQLGNFQVNLPVFAPVTPSFVFVNASNIINQGTLKVGANGWLRLNGNDLNLSRSSLEVVPPQRETMTTLFGSANFPTLGFFTPDIAIWDIFWFDATMDFNSAVLWNGVTATAPPFNETGFGGITNKATFTITPVLPGHADSLISFDTLTIIATNFTGPPDNVLTTNFVPVLVLSNVTKEAMFVGVPDGFDVTLGWVPSSENNNPFHTANIQVSVPIPDLVEQVVDTNYLLFTDQLASEPGPGRSRTLLMNIDMGRLAGGAPATERPGAFILTRYVPFPGLIGSPGLGTPPPGFFLSSGQTIDPNGVAIDRVTNSAVTGAFYAAYAAFVDNVASRPPFIPAGTATNLSGRVGIFADNSLDLTSTRMRAEGEIIINATKLIASTNTVIDAENLSFDIKSPAGTLTFQNLAKTNVIRLRGMVTNWSAQWVSTALVVITNNFAFSNVLIPLDDTGTNFDTNVVAVRAPITNRFNVNYHVFMVDAYDLKTNLPVNVLDLKLHSTNIVLNDDMQVSESMLIDGRSLTVNGNLALTFSSLPDPFNPIVAANSVSIPNWNASLAPGLLFFTNNGTISVFNEAHFGDDTLVPYEDFINNGTITAASIAINSHHIENNFGTLFTFGGPITIEDDDTSLFVSDVESAADLDFNCAQLQLTDSDLSAAGAVDFTVPIQLTDLGSFNTISVENGINLWVKPNSGDLLGTEVTSTITTSAFSQFFFFFFPGDPLPSIASYHFWGADNRGADVSGYLNNAAIGRLTLIPDVSDPTFVFEGVGADNGMYIGTLDLSALSDDFTNREMVISNNLVMYYGAIILPAGVTASLPIGVTPEQFMDGAFGGHLRYVPCFYSVCGSAGISSAPAVAITSPAQAQKVDHSTFNIEGNASSSSGKTSVYYKLNSGNWTQAQSQDGVSWLGTVHGAAGHNTLQAYAKDNISHQQSEIQSVSFDVVEESAVTIQINGSGSVGAITNGQLLTVGQTYAITAFPADGYAFSNWTGGIFTNSATASFVMTNDLVLVANFVPATYSASAGTYNGLFYESDAVEFGKSGGFSATTTSNGTFSASLDILTKHVAFSGRFDASGAATNTILRKDGPALKVVLHAQPGGKRITGSVGAANGAWTADLQAVAQAAVANGTYTVLIPGGHDSDNTETPQGDSYATIKLKANKAQVNGVLADGQKFTDSAGVSQDGWLPVYAAVNGGQGQILGWLNFTNGINEDINGWINWWKQAIPGAKFYPQQFDLQITTVTGSAYDLSASPVLNFSHVILTGGNLAASITNDVSVTPNNKVTNNGGNNLSISLVPGTGLFKGSFTDPNTGKSESFNGAVLQKQNQGGGFFLGTSLSGDISLQP
jgi:hypothetical protein